MRNRVLPIFEVGSQLSRISKELAPSSQVCEPRVKIPLVMKAYEGTDYLCFDGRHIPDLRNAFGIVDRLPDLNYPNTRISDDVSGDSMT